MKNLSLLSRLFGDQLQRGQIQVGNNPELSLGPVVNIDVAAGKRVSGKFAIGDSKYIDFILSPFVDTLQL